MTSKEALNALFRLLYEGQEFTNSEYNFWLKLYQIVAEALEKLDQFKKIEEEFGIDLITLFKGVMNGFWYKDTNGYHQIDSYEYAIDLESSRLIQLYEEHSRTFYFEDYGKTWALTKEELENG